MTIKRKSYESNWKGTMKQFESNNCKTYKVEKLRYWKTPKKQNNHVYERNQGYSTTKQTTTKGVNETTDLVWKYNNKN